MHNTNTLAVIAKNYPERLPKAIAEVQAAGSRRSLSVAEVLAAGTVGEGGELVIDAATLAKWKEPVGYFGLWG
jgi:hypothetical protein